MRVRFTDHFSRRLDGLRNDAMREKLRTTIDNIMNASSSINIPGLKKLQGHKTAYRIRIGGYRVGVFIENDMVEFADLDYRKDFYKHFPN